MLLIYYDTIVNKKAVYYTKENYFQCRKLTQNKLAQRFVRFH